MLGQGPSWSAREHGAPGSLQGTSRTHVAQTTPVAPQAGRRPEDGHDLGLARPREVGRDVWSRLDEPLKGVDSALR